jgi:hypothetical protein
MSRCSTPAPVLPGRPRSYALAAALTLCVACSSPHPAAPTPATTDTPIAVQAGQYQLTVSTGNSSGAPVPGSVFACTTSGSAGGSAPQGIVVHLTLQSAGGTLEGRASSGSLVLTLRQDGNDVSGTMTGTATDATGTTTLLAGGNPSGPAILSGRVRGSALVDGTTDGGVVFRSGTAFNNCNTNTWSLTK